MAAPQLPDAGDLTGDERLTLRQGGRARGLTFAMLRDWLMAATQGAITAALAPLAARLSALETADAAQAARLAILEVRPEEVAHFTAQARFPALAIGARFTLALTGLTPARTGDILRASEQVEAWPTGDVPAGITFGRPVVTADNTVAIPCTAGLAVAASSAAVPFALAALR